MAEEGPPPIQIVASEVVPLKEARASTVSQLVVHLDPWAIEDTALQQFKETLESAESGPCQVVVVVTRPAQWEAVVQLSERYKVAPTDALVSRIEHLFGENVVTLV